MSSVNEKLHKQLIAHGFDVKKINTSPSTLNRDLTTLSLRWLPLIKGWLFLLFKLKKEDTLYLAPSAGWGQVYDIVTVLIAKLKNIQKLLIHHHSFKYLEQVNFINRIFFSLTKNTSTHIVLCEEMAKKLHATYQGHQAFVLSNFSILFQNNLIETEKVRQQKDGYKIGYLSNITKEKGGWLIIKLAKELQKNNIPAQVFIAGPCQEPDLEGELKNSQRKNILIWLGPVYDEEKQHFFDSIDVFILPSQNEAEPLVIWEAICHQVPVISYNRGCISDQLQQAGIVLDRNDDFVLSSVRILQNWLHEPSKYQNKLQETYKQYILSKKTADIQWNNFLRILQ